MRIILLGCPGAGKGTQSEFISCKYHIPKIATGDMLRTAIEEKTAIGQLAAKFVKSGTLVPDNIIINIVKEHIQKLDCKNGFLLDGFPRTLAQAQALHDAQIKIDGVIEMEVDDEEVISRLSGRRTHPASGRTYHILFNPPKTEGLDDITHEPLIQREDDQEFTIKKRLEVYRLQTKPLIDYYRDLQNREGNLVYAKINAQGHLNEVSCRLTEILDSFC